MCKEETTVRLNSLKMALMGATTQSENLYVIEHTQYSTIKLVLINRLYCQTTVMGSPVLFGNLKLSQTEFLCFFVSTL